MADTDYKIGILNKDDMSSVVLPRSAPFVGAFPFRVIEKNGQYILPPALKETRTIDLGQPYLTDLSFLLDDGTEIKMPIPPVIKVTLTKTIVQTNVAGRKGSIKEIVSSDDYRIHVDGFAFTPGDAALDVLSPSAKFQNVQTYPTIENRFEKSFDGEFPDDLLDDLKRVALQDYALGVNCALLNLLGINYVVIQNWSLPLEADMYGHFRYTLDMISDAKDDGLELLTARSK